MRILFMTITLGAMIWATGLAQASAQPQDQTPASPQQPQAQLANPSGPTRIAAGSVIPVQLTKTVDAKKAKAGEEVDVKVTDDMKTNTGAVLLPKDTTIVGHVTEAQPRTKEQKESQLGITFDRAVMKDGGNMTLPASIQAVIAPPNQNPNDVNSSGGGMAAPASGAASPQGAPGGRSGMGGEQPQQTPGSYPNGDDQAGNGSGNTPAMPRITTSTQGVIGISNYKLSTPGTVSQGSVVSSEKGNVKLESGTLMLLRVNQ